MSTTSATRPDGPIPGANYTSDTRNWPWHRPPDITTIDDALEHVMERLTDTPSGMRYMSLIEAGTPLTTITDIIVTLAIGRGKFTPDFAILVAGPVTRMLEIMAKSYKIEYTLGIDEDVEFTTPVVYKEAIRRSLPKEEEAPEVVEEAVIEEEQGGLMSAVSSEEQASMLGYDEELEDE